MASITTVYFYMYTTNLNIFFFLGKKKANAHVHRRCSKQNLFSNHSFDGKMLMCCVSIKPMRRKCCMLSILILRERARFLLKSCVSGFGDFIIIIFIDLYFSIKPMFDLPFIYQYGRRVNESDCKRITRKRNYSCRNNIQRTKTDVITSSRGREHIEGYILY